MKKIQTLLMAAAMMAGPFVFTSCEDILGHWEKPAPAVITSDPTPETVVEDARALGAALEAGAMVAVNYTVGTSSYVATFQKNSDDSYTLISNAKVSAARAVTRAADPPYTVPTGDGAAIGDKILLTLVGDQLVLTVKDTAGTPIFEAYLTIEAGKVVVINTNAGGLDCTIISVSVNDQARDIKNTDMKSVKIEQGALSYFVKYSEGETWADVIKRYENIELVDISTTDLDYVSAQFSKELVVETLMAEQEITQADAEDSYTKKYSGSFFLTTSASTYVTANVAVGTSTTNSLIVETPPMLTPLTFEAVNEGATINITFENTLSKAVDLQYSLDGGLAWQSLHIDAGKPQYTDQSSNSHPASPGTKTLSGIKQILFKAENESYGELSSVCLDASTEYERKLHISVDADCYIYGNMMSLVGGDQFATRTDLKEDRTFEGMFMDEKKLKSHPAKMLLLPATTLTNMCYRYMFWNCTALTVAPDLPAKVMKEKCYSGMFTGCDALKATPALPATTLAKSCYYGMFSNCSALTSASDLPASKLEPYCYQEMFRGCTSLTKAPELLATKAAEYSCASMFWGCSALKTAPSKLAATVAEHCYDSMFDNCTFLESAPELPAKTMAPYCYAAMFRRCPSLETAPALPATTLANHCYDSMFYNQEDVSGYKLKNAPALPATTLADHCYTYMFNGCRALTKAPDLPAKKLENGCYVCMFNNCTSLNYLKCFATSIASDATIPPTYNWLRGVPGNGHFYKDKSVNYASGEFWDTSLEYGTTTKCAAKVLNDGNWTVQDAN